MSELFDSLKRFINEGFTVPSIKPRKRFQGDEESFQKWYKGWAEVSGINPNPDDPSHAYDYRSAFKAGDRPYWQPEHKQYRWPDRWKQRNHPNLDNGR